MPDTWMPYRAAYAVVALVLAGYAFSIWWRAKRAREQLRARNADSSPRS